MLLRVVEEEAEPHVLMRHFAAQIYDAAGNTVGSNFVVNEHIDDDQRLSDVVGLAGGGFVAAYTTDTASQTDTGTGIAVRIFDNSGVAQGGETQANTTIDFTGIRFDGHSSFRTHLKVDDSPTFSDASSRSVPGSRPCRGPPTVTSRC